MLFCQDISDRMACIGASVIWSKDSTSVAGGEPTNHSTKLAIKYGRVVFPCLCLCIIGVGSVPGISE